MLNEQLIKSILLRAVETSIWCKQRLVMNDLEHCLRTELLHPPINQHGREIITFSSVEELSQKRSEILSLLNSGKNGPCYSGRILAFDVANTLGDGAAESESEGFFDISNRPAWDTWLMYVTDTPKKERRELFDSYLLSWVPYELIDIVQSAIDVNPEGCIEWADKIRKEFLMHLSNQMRTHTK